MAEQNEPLTLKDLDSTNDNPTPPSGSGEKTAEERKAEEQIGIDTPPNPDGVDATKTGDNKRPDDPGDAAGKTGAKPEGEKDAKEDEEDEESKEDDDNKEEDDEDFYAVVDKMRGEDISSQIDYPEGIEPTSPEGVIVREQFIEKLGATKFEEYLKQTDPRGYAYLLHRKDGGDDEAFFNKPSFVAPTDDELENSVDLQREVYERSLMVKGNSPKQAKALVEMAIKDGELQQEALKASQEMRETERKHLEEVDKALATKRKLEQTSIKEFSDELNDVVTKGDALKFIIPEADKPKFLEELKQNIIYEGGKFYLVKPLDSKALPSILQTELFGYLKGDLNKLIERKAKSVAAKKLTLKASTKDTPKASHKMENQMLTLGEL